MTDPDRCNVSAIIVIPPTALSELPVPERFVAIHLQPKSCKACEDSIESVDGDNDIVPIDTHATGIRLNVFAGQPASVRILYSEKDHSKEHHGLHRKAERRTHGRELGQTDHTVATNVSRTGSSRIDRLEERREVLQHCPYMLIGDSIGGLTKVDGRETIPKRSLTGHALIRRLVRKADHPRGCFIGLEEYREFLPERLLHVLHAGRLLAITRGVFNVFGTRMTLTGRSRPGSRKSTRSRRL